MGGIFLASLRCGLSDGWMDRLYVCCLERASGLVVMKLCLYVFMLV